VPGALRVRRGAPGVINQSDDAQHLRGVLQAGVEVRSAPRAPRTRPAPSIHRQPAAARAANIVGGDGRDSDTIQRVRGDVRADRRLLLLVLLSGANRHVLHPPGEGILLGVRGGVLNAGRGGGRGAGHHCSSEHLPEAGALPSMPQTLNPEHQATAPRPSGSLNPTPSIMNYKLYNITYPQL